MARAFTVIDEAMYLRALLCLFSLDGQLEPICSSSIRVSKKTPKRPGAGQWTFLNEIRTIGLYGELERCCTLGMVRLSSAAAIEPPPFNRLTAHSRGTSNEMSFGSCKTWEPGFFCRLDYPAALHPWRSRWRQLQKTKVACCLQSLAEGFMQTKSYAAWFSVFQ